MKFLELGVCVLPAPTAVGELAQVVPTWANFHALLDCINAGGGGGVGSVTGTAPIVITGTPAIPNVTITDFIASGASHARGAVPDPGAVAGVTKFLREDATWQVPAGGGTVTSVTGTAPIVITGAAATPNVTISVMGASGGTHAPGSTPDTPAVAGTTKFLREDGTWVIAGASGTLQGEEFTATGAFTFNVPALVTSVWCTFIAPGGGGGGNNGSTTGGGGGGGGEYAVAVPLKVTAGGTVTGSIGAGGAGGVAGLGGTGGTTTVGPYTAFGGKGGGINGLVGQGGGPRGGGGTTTSGAMGTAEAPGFFGGSNGGSAIPATAGSTGGGSGGKLGGTGGSTTGGNGGGGGGASTVYGQGGTGGNATSGNGNAPASAASYGAGGGGGAATTSNGGAGNDGYALIQWVGP